MFINKSYTKEYNIDNYLKNKNKDMFFKLGDKIEVIYYDISDDEVTKKKFVGSCISLKNKGSNNYAFILRFNYKQDLVDQQFFFNSPLICSIKLVESAHKFSNFYKIK